MFPISPDDHKRTLDVVFSNSHLIIIDNAGFLTETSDASYTSQVKLPKVNFMFADALQPPFHSESFDTVASNGLFFYLTRGEEAGQKNAEGEKRKKLLQEVIRILRPGGVYVGVELYKKVDPIEYLEAGFSEVMQHPPLMLTSRRYLNELLSNPNSTNAELEELMRQGKLEYELDMELVFAKK